MEDIPLSQLLTLINEGKLTELQAERLLNAASRFRSGTPTGVAQSPEQHDAHHGR